MKYQEQDRVSLTRFFFVKPDNGTTSSMVIAMKNGIAIRCEPPSFIRHPGDIMNWTRNKRTGFSKRSSHGIGAGGRRPRSRGIGNREGSIREIEIGKSNLSTSLMEVGHGLMALIPCMSVEGFVWPIAAYACPAHRSDGSLRGAVFELVTWYSSLFGCRKAIS
jgi:hypothetical protein